MYDMWQTEVPHQVVAHSVEDRPFAFGRGWRLVMADFYIESIDEYGDMREEMNQLLFDLERAIRHSLIMEPF